MGDFDRNRWGTFTEISMKKKILITILVILVAPIIFLALYFTYCNIVYEGEEDSVKVSYLKGHKFVIDDKCVSIPQAFGTKIPTGKGCVFLFGELHGFSSNHLLDAKQLISLSKNRGVRTYGAEITAEDAEKLNHIIDTDSLDEKGLASVIHDIGKDTPQNQTVEYMNKWKEIYAYNRNVDKDHKIHVVGLLGKKDEQKGLLRDQVMAQSLLKFMLNPANNSLVKNGCYCFVGLSHAFQAPYVIQGRTIQTFGSILKEHQLKVTSMVEAAIDSYCYMPKVDGMITPPDETTKLASSNGPLCFFNNIINLEEASEGTKAAIYALDGKGSPYRHCDDFVGTKASLPFIYPSYQSLPSHSTLDYFQYVFVINGHQVPEPMK